MKLGSYIRRGSNWDRLFSKRAGLILLVIGVLIATMPQACAVGKVETWIPSEEECSAILHIIRSRISPAENDVLEMRPPVGAPNNLPLIVNVYYEGNSGLQIVSAQQTLRESAAEAGELLVARFAQIAAGKAILANARLKVDVVTSHEPIREKRRYLIANEIEFGFHGLISTEERRTVYFTPLAVLGHSDQPDILNALYMSQESMRAPPRVQLERTKTVSFVEETPGGKPLMLCRGNVLMQDPSAEQMIMAAALGGIWLLNMQDEDGSFIREYSPAKRAVAGSGKYNLVEHMRATQALLSLYQLTGDNRFKTAYEQALRLVCSALQEERREGIVYLCADIGREDGKKLSNAGSEEDVRASALLLTTLCVQAAGETNPTANGLMKYLGEYLCLMTDPDGGIYATLGGARAKRGPFLARGEPYGEALHAMVMLLHISPTEKLRQTAAAMTARITSSNESGPTMAPRIIEALAEYYKLTRDERSGEAVLALGELFAAQQITRETAKYPDYCYGFASLKLPPDTQTTSEIAAGIATVCDVAQLMRKPDKRFAVSCRQAGEFLVNMQFRPQNSFFLAQHGAVLGGFRHRPQDLIIGSSETAQAVRALISVTAVMARSERSEMSENVLPNAAATD